MSKPLAIDLFCGLGGWTEGLLAEGYEAWGFDIEAHEYGDEKYPGKLHLEDVQTIDGARFAHAALIVASPPCQEFSYMAMPWSRAKAKAAAIRADETGAELARLTALFDACFRIQREASAAAGRHIPMVIENVKGAQPWVGPAKWSFGSFYLWGDVPALMPKALSATKNTGGSWFNIAHNTTSGVSNNPDGRKNRGDWLGSGADCSLQRRSASGSKARKAASAKIAKIPFALSSWIARTYKPTAERAA